MPFRAPLPLYYLNTCAIVPAIANSAFITLVFGHCFIGNKYELT